MSRDWRPIEFVIVDEQAYKSRGEYLHDARFTLQYEGTEKPIYDDEARKYFPNLSFLLDRFESVVYKEIKEDPKAYHVYAQIETDLMRLANAVRQGVREDEKIDLSDIETQKMVKDWFTGELDSGFYYNEQNNVAFYEWINEQICIEKHQPVPADDYFYLQEQIDPDGYNGLGFGYVYIVDEAYQMPIHDENGEMFRFDIDENDRPAAYQEAKEFVQKNYDRLCELSEQEYGKDHEERE